MLNQEEQNINWDKWEFIDIGLPYHDIGFNLSRTLEDSANMLPRWLLEGWEKWLSTQCEIKMPEIAWKIVEEEIKSLQNWSWQWKRTHYKIRKLTSQVFFFLQKNSKDIPFTKAINNVLARGAPPLLRSLLAVLCRPGMTIGNAVIKLVYLMEKVQIGYKNNGNQMSVIYIQEQSGCNYCNKQQSQSGSQGVLICREL